MADKKKLIDLLQSKGLFFPTTSEEVEEFEKLMFPSDDVPADFENPENIIRRGMQKLDQIKIGNIESLSSEIQELKMVARKGSNLPQHLIDKMTSKHKKKDDK